MRTQKNSETYPAQAALSILAGWPQGTTAWRRELPDWPACPGAAAPSASLSPARPGARTMAERASFDLIIDDPDAHSARVVRQQRRRLACDSQCASL